MSFQQDYDDYIFELEQSYEVVKSVQLERLTVSQAKFVVAHQENCREQLETIRSAREESLAAYQTADPIERERISNQISLRRSGLANAMEVLNRTIRELSS